MDVDIAVVGAGLVGLSFARALRDLSVALLAPEAPPPAPARDAPFGARIYAISPGNVAFLRALRVWQRIPQARVAPVHSMQVHGDDGRARLAFDAYRAGVEALAWIVEDAALQAALWQALEDREHCEQRVGTQCTALDVDERGVRLRLGDGGTLAARLVVCADGAQSPLRAMAGIAVRACPYGQSAVVANFECERRHDNVARKWFQGGPILALLPLPGERVSMVWSLPERRAEALLGSTPEALCREVEQASG
ncbi:MAG: FAD-dependent monooxygenase, partial [Burkholderiales bacterium]